MVGQCVNAGSLMVYNFVTRALPMGRPVGLIAEVIHVFVSFYLLRLVLFIFGV